MRHRSLSSICYPAAPVVGYIGMEFASIFYAFAQFRPQFCGSMFICAFEIHINNFNVLHNVEYLLGLEYGDTPEQTFRVRPMGVMDDA